MGQERGGGTEQALSALSTNILYQTTIKEKTSGAHPLTGDWSFLALPGGQITTVCNFGSSGSNALFWLLSSHVYIPTHRQTFIHIIIKVK